MPTLPIPLFTKTHKGVDDSVLTDNASVQYNGFLDELDGLNIRPGEVLASNTGKRNDGLYFWPDKSLIVSVDEGQVILRSSLGSSLIDAYASGVASFAPGSVVSFCNDSNYVFLAGGGKINYVNSIGVVSEISDVDAPNSVSHVKFLDGYILAINGDGKLYYSEVPNTLNWSALGFATAEGNPDKTVSLEIVQRQIYILGSITTEIWENDGETPFSRIPGGLIEMGCGAKHSPIKRQNSLIWLNHLGQFVEFTGTTLKMIGGRYDREVSRFSVISDCIGGQVLKDGQEYCIFQFPSEQRTLVYNPAKEDWSEWGQWDSSGMTWLPYDYRSSALDLNTRKMFIGKEAAKVIACLDSDSRVDLTGASSSRNFKFLRKTGFINHGTNRNKRLKELTFRVKRGSGDSTNPKLLLRYRNDGSSQWSGYIEIGLGNIGETEHLISIKSLGLYSSRQFEISTTDNAPLVLSGAEAEISVS